MKDKAELQEDAGLVRDIEAWCKVEYPANDNERLFRDALFKKAFAEIGHMEPQHVRRINEALCDMKYPTPAALGLRGATILQLSKFHNLKNYRTVKMPVMPMTEKRAA